MRKFLTDRIKNRRQNKKLMFQWVVSYTSVLLLPILICSFYYAHSYNVIKQRTASNQQLILENSKEQIDYIFYDTINLSNHLQLNKYINALSFQKSTVNSVPSMDKYYLNMDLKAFKIANSLLKEISVYFPGSGYIVSSTSVYEKAMVDYMTNPDIRSEIWDSLCGSVGGHRMVCIVPEGKDDVLLAKALLTDAHQAPASILVIQLDKNMLLRRMENDLLPGGGCEFALIDNDRILLSSGSGKELADSLPIPAINRYFQENPEERLLDTSRLEASSRPAFMVSRYATLIPDVSLISVTDKKTYGADLYKLLEVLFLTLIICIVTGLLVIFYYSRRNYRPIARIIHYIGDCKPDDTSPNEYGLIMKMLTQNRSEIEQQHSLLRNNYLQKILNGEIPFGQISPQIAERFRLSFPSPCSCIILLGPDEAWRAKDTDLSWEKESPAQLLYFIIQNVCEELLEPQFPNSYFCLMHNRVAVLINVPESLDQPEAVLKETIAGLFRFLSDTYQIQLNAGISDKCLNENIPDAFLQADNALEYAEIFEDEHLCLYGTIPQTSRIGAVHLNSSEYITNLVTSGNREQLDDYFRTLRAELADSRLTAWDAKSCYYFFYSATARLRLCCQTRYGFLPESLEFTGRDFFRQPLADILSITHKGYSALLTDLQNRLNEQDNRSWCQDVCHYIENNYFDLNMNLNNIAEHFHLSPSYLSRRFKECYNNSVNDYLYEIRIAHAVKLIRDTSLKISDIAQMTGFSDSNAFIRIFKRCTGTTPGRYKEQNK